MRAPWECTAEETQRLLDAGWRFGWYPPWQPPVRLLTTEGALDALDASQHTTVPDTLPRDW
jgi:hypothetical protein